MKNLHKIPKEKGARKRSRTRHTRYAWGDSYSRTTEDIQWGANAVYNIPYPEYVSDNVTFTWTFIPQEEALRQWTVNTNLV